MISIEIVKDNTDKVLAEVESNTKDVLAAIGKVIADEAKEIVPVDTGALRDSITYDVENDSVRVGSPLEYSIYVELGTSKMAPQPYIRPAFENNKEMIEATVKKGYKL